MSAQDPVTPPGCVPLEDLSALVDAELSPADAARVSAHASDCARCQALLARLGGTSRLVSSLPREIVSEERVREVAAAARAAGPTAAPARRAWMRWAAAAAMVLGGFVVFRIAQQFPSEEALPMPRAVREAPASASREQDVRAARKQEHADLGNEAASLATPQRADIAATQPGDPSSATPSGIEAALESKVAFEEARPEPPRAQAPPTAEIAQATEAEMASADAVEAGSVLRDDAARQRRAAAPVAPAPSAAPVLPEERTIASAPAEDAAGLAPAANATGAARLAGAPEAGDLKAGDRDAGESERDGGLAASSRREAAKDASCDRPRPLAEEQPRAPSTELEPALLLQRADPVRSLTWPESAVRIEAIVEIDGRLTPCRIAPPLAPADERALRDALARWRYRPARLAGRPQASFVTVEIPSVR